MTGQGRVVFVIKLKPGMSEEFLEAYEGVRHEVAEGVKGHIIDQVCQSPEDPDTWLITSEWDSVEDFFAWEATEKHREQAKPMRDCMAEAQSYKFIVREETRNPGEGGMIKRGCIIAKIKPGSEEAVAKLFAESDESELPALAGVRHRSLFMLEDVYVHYVELDDEFAEAVDSVRDHPLFKEISRKLDDYITPYNPETWKSPKDAQAIEFYSWDPPGTE